MSKEVYRSFEGKLDVDCRDGYIILELKDKIAAEEMFEEFVTEKPVTSSDSGKENLKGVVQDAVEALVVLGYPKMDAVRAVQMVEMSEDMTVEELLKQSLKNL